MTMERQVYNYSHSRARRVIENSFKILVEQWKILRQPLECLPDKAVNIGKTCIVLHNFLAYSDDTSTPGSRYIPANFADPDSFGSSKPGK